MSRRGEFRPERVDHVEVAAERPVFGDILVGVRAFRQRGDDQIVTLFGVAAVDDAVNTGHYRVGSAGDFDAMGWGVSVSRTVGEGTRASLDYSRAGADWNGRSPDFWRSRAWRARCFAAPTWCTTSPPPSRASCR